MDDYAEHLAKMPRKLAELTNLLNDKKWEDAEALAHDMAVDCMTIADYAEDMNKRKI